MTKELIFDMDGTIANLYKVCDWEPRLNREEVSPYEEAAPIYDMDILRDILNKLKSIGFKILVVSWGAMHGSNEYTRAVKKAKKNWLDKYQFPYDEIHVVKYGTPKANFISSDISLLVDDNKEVQESFLKSKKATGIIDAKSNIIKELEKLI